MTDSDLIWEVLGQTGAKEAVLFKDGVAHFIEKCIDAGGKPVFISKFNNSRFRGNLLLGVCADGKERMKFKWFCDVPYDVLDKIENGQNDYTWLLDIYLKHPARKMNGKTEYEKEIKKRFGIG